MYGAVAPLPYKHFWHAAQLGKGTVLPLTYLPPPPQLLVPAVDI